jgi:hypothetical protein
MHSGDETAKYTWFFLFLFLLVTTEVSLSSYVICYHPVDSHYHHKPAADISHLTSYTAGFPGPS